MNNKIEDVEAKIEQVEADITAGEILCFVCYVNNVCVCLSRTAKRGKESGTAKRQLREKERQLREEKRQLREKERQLREERLLREREQQPKAKRQKGGMFWLRWS